MQNVRTLVAESMRDILLALEQPRAARSAPVADTAAMVAQAAEPQRKIILDASAATRLESGNIILADKERGMQVRWTVFVRTGAQETDELVEYFMRGSANASLEPEGFVLVAYRLVLGRRVDQAGNALYTEMMQSGRLSQYDLLRALAGSKEAQAREDRLLIVGEQYSADGEHSLALPPTGRPFGVLISQ